MHMADALVTPAVAGTAEPEADGDAYETAAAVYQKFWRSVNTAAPIHVKQDSLVHNVLAKFVTMPGEKEEYTARGKKFRLNVASSAGMLPAGPFMTTYYATKAYAASFTRAVERNV